jgi:purine-nucleoside phosphorylase
LLIDNLQEATNFIRGKTALKPKVGIVLGSGLGHFVNKIQVDLSLPFAEIPHFAPATVEGHNGHLLIGTVGEQAVACLQGRIHYYEGHPMHQVVFPVRTLALLGVETIILTNAAGSLREQNKAGSFLIIKDHINLMGDNPLKGPNLKHLGPRFPDMTETYDKKLIQTMTEVFKFQKIPFATGNYCGVSGPTYETPAEVQYLRMIGGDAVGMSTVPEAIAANHLGLRIAALSCLTNMAAGLSAHKLTHEEVTMNAKQAEHNFCNFLVEFLKRI